MNTVIARQGVIPLNWFICLRRTGPWHRAVREKTGYLLKCGHTITRWYKAIDADLPAQLGAIPLPPKRCRRCFP